MLTAMTEEDWTIVLRVFAASRVETFGEKGSGRSKRSHCALLYKLTFSPIPGEERSRMHLSFRSFEENNCCLLATSCESIAKSW